MAWLLGVCFLFHSFVIAPRIVTGKDFHRFSNVAHKTLSLQEIVPLKAGEPVKREIKGGEKQAFRITIAMGQYCRLVVQQHGILLAATLFDPNGQLLVLMDNPSGGHGPIYLSTIAEVSGDYRLEVQSAEAWANAGTFDLSIDELREVRPGDKDRVDAERSFAKGRRDTEAGARETALAEFGKALLYWRSIQDRHWEALTQYALGQAYRKFGNRKKAAECFRESLAILDVQSDPNDWRLKAAALNDLGLSYALSGENEKALATLKGALSIFEAHGDTRGQASSLNNLSITHGRMGELRKAREFAERALPLRQADNFQSGVNSLRNTLGMIYDKLGDPYRSLEYHEQALAGWQDLAKTTPLDPERLANALSSAAIANEKVANWDKARQYYEQAFAVPNITAATQAAILNNQADLYASFADFDNALTRLAQAKTRLDSLENPDPDLKASVLLELGQVQAATGDLTKALEYLQLAQNTKPNDPKLAYVLTALGDTWSRQGNLQEAMKAYAAALDIQLKIEDRRGQALTRQKLGEAYASSGNSNAALKEYELSLELWRAVVDRRGEAATLNSIAYFERNRNNLGRALQLSEQATSMLESLRTSVSNYQLRTSYFASHENFYELNIDLKMRLARDAQSPESLSAALAASERSRARSLIDILSESRADVTEGASNELLRLDREVQLKLRAKLDAQTVLLSTRHNEREAQILSQEVSDLISQQDELRGRIRTSSPNYLQLTEPQTLTLSEIQLQLDGDTLLLEYALGDKRSYVWVVSRSSIDGFELAGREEIEAVARRVTQSLAAPSLEVKNESFAQKQLRLDKAEKDYPQAAAALSEMVLGRVASQLGQKRLVIVADGALQMVPFSALPVPAITATAENAKQGLSTNVSAGPATGGAPVPLLAEHEIITLPSASVLALQRRELADRKPANLAVAVIADPVFDKKDIRVANANVNGNQHRKPLAKNKQDAAPPPKQSVSSLPEQSVPSSPATSGLTDKQSPLATALRDVGLNPEMQRLPFSLREAKAILRAAPANKAFSALNFKASRATATSAELSKYRIIHFATHGVMDLEHPELSGIVLSMVDENGQSVDGYLRLHEIYNLNLPAELVVLSACQTGIGKQVKGEGLIALTRGFMYAGARSVVASLWKVDDSATAELMAEFYRQMFTNNLKPAAALRAAQLKLAQQKRWQSPYYWAGFFIQGEWR